MNAKVEIMTKDNFIKENAEFDQSSGNKPEMPTEDTADPKVQIEHSIPSDGKAHIFSYLSAINRVELIYTEETLKIKYQSVDPLFVFPTQDTIDVAKQKIALRVETHIENAFSLGAVEKKEAEKQLSSQWKWRIIAIALLMLGIAGISANTIYGNYSANKIERTTQAALKKIKKEHAEKEKEQKRSVFKEQPYQPIETYLDDSDSETYLGVLAIPDVNLNLPIVKGVGEQNLYRGAATNKIGQQMGQGNYPMAAHKVPGNDTSLFGPLFNVTPGMKIYLSDNQNIYIYNARESYVVEPERVDILDDIPGQTVLTLYTCSTDAGVERLVVQADFEKKLKKTDASPEEQAIFSAE